MQTEVTKIGNVGLTYIVGEATNEIRIDPDELASLFSEWLHGGNRDDQRDMARSMRVWSPLYFFSYSAIFDFRTSLRYFTNSIVRM